MNLCREIDFLPEEGVIYVPKMLDWVPHADAKLYMLDYDGNDALPEEPIEDDYFLEVETAREVIEVWNKWNGEVSNPLEICEAVIYYAKFDAYKEPKIWNPEALH